MPKLQNIFLKARIRFTDYTKHFSFERENRIGHGAFADVFKQVLRGGRTVAVKIGRKLASDARFFLENESKALEGLMHPHIVRMYDHGEIREGKYIALEYVKAKTLDEYLIKNGPLAAEEALKVTEKTADALRYFYRKKGKVHGDVKPGNIFYDPKQGLLKLSDFAFASRAGRELKCGYRCFTPSYATIEQLEGKNPGLCEDIFALGATLYKALTGEVAIPGRSNEILDGHAQLGHKIRKSRDIPDALKQLLLQMTVPTGRGTYRRYFYGNSGEEVYDNLLSDIAAARKKLAESRMPKKAPIPVAPDLQPSFSQSYRVL